MNFEFLKSPLSRFLMAEHPPGGAGGGGSTLPGTSVPVPGVPGGGGNLSSIPGILTREYIAEYKNVKLDTTNTTFATQWRARYSMVVVSQVDDPFNQTNGTIYGAPIEIWKVSNRNTLGVYEPVATKVGYFSISTSQMGGTSIDQGGQGKGYGLTTMWICADGTIRNLSGTVISNITWETSKGHTKFLPDTIYLAINFANTSFWGYASAGSNRGPSTTYTSNVNESTSPDKQYWADSSYGADSRNWPWFVTTAAFTSVPPTPIYTSYPPYLMTSLVRLSDIEVTGVSPNQRYEVLLRCIFWYNENTQWNSATSDFGVPTDKVVKIGFEWYKASPTTDTALSNMEFDVVDQSTGSPYTSFQHRLLIPGQPNAMSLPLPKQPVPGGYIRSIFIPHLPPASLYRYRAYVITQGGKKYYSTLNSQFELEYSVPPVVALSDPFNSVPNDSFPWGRFKTGDIDVTQYYAPASNIGAWWQLYEGWEKITSDGTQTNKIFPYLRVRKYLSNAASYPNNTSITGIHPIHYYNNFKYTSQKRYLIRTTMQDYFNANSQSNSPGKITDTSSMGMNFGMRTPWGEYMDFIPPILGIPITNLVSGTDIRPELNYLTRVVLNHISDINSFDLETVKTSTPSIVKPISTLTSSRSIEARKNPVTYYANPEMNPQSSMYSYDYKNKTGLCSVDIFETEWYVQGFAGWAMMGFTASSPTYDQILTSADFDTIIIGLNNIQPGDFVEISNSNTKKMGTVDTRVVPVVNQSTIKVKNIDASPPMLGATKIVKMKPTQAIPFFPPDKIGGVNVGPLGGKGWHYEETSKSFIWFDYIKPGALATNDLNKNMPLGRQGLGLEGQKEILSKSSNFTLQKLKNNGVYKFNTNLYYLLNNYIAKWIDYQTFNIEFDYENKTPFTISVYMSSELPNTNVARNNNVISVVENTNSNPSDITTALDVFESLIAEGKMIKVTTIPGDQSKRCELTGITGKKFIIFRATPVLNLYLSSNLNKRDIADQSSTDTYTDFNLNTTTTLLGLSNGRSGGGTYSSIKISNIRVSGGYNEVNNEIVVSTQSNYGLSLQGAEYSTKVGFGSNIIPNSSNLSSAINAKMGNGTFLSGIWENGVWNSGWRDDPTMYELYKVESFYSYNSDKSWRIRISGDNEVGGRFTSGDRVSVSNIAIIDINEDRNILKRSVVIAEVGTNYIDFDYESDFPLRRFEIDSNQHRILVSKNVWQSGLFLNGYFKGIWNNGFFSGFPIITKMEDTHWIDGIFNGGHFQAKKRAYTFESRSLVDYNGVARLGLSFSSSYKIAKDDIISITYSTSTKALGSLGTTIVIDVIDDYNIVTGLAWDPTHADIKNGTIYSLVSTGLIQNFNFYSNNVSKVTSLETMQSDRVFSYNSWIDVNYSNQTAVNIGRPQTQLETTSNRSYSENNLYGYPTNDVLSSTSVFRDSFSTTFRKYRLGKKYKILGDYVGDSSSFEEFFESTDTVDGMAAFKEQGWDMNSIGITSTTVNSTSAKLLNGKLALSTTPENLVLGFDYGSQITITGPAAENAAPVWNPITDAYLLFEKYKSQWDTSTPRGAWVDLAERHIWGKMNDDNQSLYVKDLTTNVWYGDQRARRLSSYTKLEYQLSIYHVLATDFLPLIFTIGWMVYRSNADKLRNRTKPSTEDYLDGSLPINTDPTDYFEGKATLMLSVGGTTTTKGGNLTWTTNHPSYKNVNVAPSTLNLQSNTQQVITIDFNQLKEVIMFNKTQVGWDGYGQDFEWEDLEFKTLALSYFPLFTVANLADPSFPRNIRIHLATLTPIKKTTIATDTAVVDNTRALPGSQYVEIATDSVLDAPKQWDVTNTDIPFTIVTSKYSGLTFSRSPEPITNDSNSIGKEMMVNVKNRGGVLNLIPAYNISNRINGDETTTIRRNRYSMVEFDLIDYKTGSKNNDVFYIDEKGESIPPIHLNNLNYSNRIIDGKEQTIKSTFLPVNRNINHLTTIGVKKQEFFFNKRNLLMNFKGVGLFGQNDSIFYLDNIKLYETDMIPFFQYFRSPNPLTGETGNINTSVQVPTFGIAPSTISDVNDATLSENVIDSEDSIEDLITYFGNSLLMGNEEIESIINWIGDYSINRTQDDANTTPPPLPPSISGNTNALTGANVQQPSGQQATIGQQSSASSGGSNVSNTPPGGGGSGGGSVGGAAIGGGTSTNTASE
jgi:hypothetical protein